MKYEIGRQLNILRVVCVQITWKLWSQWTGFDPNLGYSGHIRRHLTPWTENCTSSNPTAVDLHRGDDIRPGTPVPGLRDDGWENHLPLKSHREDIPGSWLVKS